MPEMSRLSPSGKYILLPTTFKVPAVGAQPCRILKQILQAQQGRARKIRKHRPGGGNPPAVKEEVRHFSLWHCFRSLPDRVQFFQVCYDSGEINSGGYHSQVREGGYPFLLRGDSGLKDYQCSAFQTRVEIAVNLFHRHRESAISLKKFFQPFDMNRFR